MPNLFLACSLDPDSDPLLPRTHLPKAPRATCTEREREFTRAECQWVCVCGWPRVWGMSVVVTISVSVSVRANVSLSSEIRDVIGFWASLRKKTSKGAASANKTQIWKTSELLSRLPMLPTNATQRNETRRIGNVHGTAPVFVLCLVITLFCTLLRIMRVVRPQRQKLASKSDHWLIYSSFRENSNYPFEKLLFRVRKM